MAPADRPESSIRPGQVREYILSMLDGLSCLAESAGDADTGKRVRQFAGSLIAGWSPRPLRPHPDGHALDSLAAANGETPADGPGDPARIF
jgi:hypothetical protein